MSFQSPAGTPSNGQKLDIFIRSNNAASGWTLAFAAAGYYGVTGALRLSTSIIGPEAIPGTLPTGRMLLLSFRYTTAGSINRWLVTSVLSFPHL
jgi:hypothetical protein